MTAVYYANLYTSIKVMVAPASGYTSGQALQAIAEVAKENLPAGYGYELGGMAREEASTSGSSTGIIFILCFVFVYLLLSAQYESYILPLSVLLSVPFGLLGSFLFVNGFAALGNIPALKMILHTCPTFQGCDSTSCRERRMWCCNSYR